MNSKNGKKVKKPNGRFKTSPPAKEQQDRQEEEHEKAADYGGLPARDLKKNLGCG